jgi:hypothetical protein
MTGNAAGSENKTMRTSNFSPERIEQLKRRFAEIASSLCDNWTVDQDNEPIYKLLFDYFLDIPNQAIDYRKGILLIGGVGPGKSTIFRQFQKFLTVLNHPNFFRMTESRLITRDFLRDGIEGLEKWTFNYQQNQHGVTLPQPFALCIDDLGLEAQEISNYGQKVDVISEIMADRYQLFINRGIKTHAITNLADDLKKNYDERINDRFREMFNVVKLTGKSRRK